jgi:hypothetical protein
VELSVMSRLEEPMQAIYADAQDIKIFLRQLKKIFKCIAKNIES